MTWDAETFFVDAKREIVALAPAEYQPLVSVFLSIMPLLAVFPALFALTTILERKGLGRIQNRYGPNRVGPCGLFQPVADGLKTLFKETVQPLAADRVVFFLAPVFLVLPALLAYSVIPYGQYMVPLEMDAALLFFFAVGAGTELAVFMAGWASRNKYALLGAMRAIAQMLSYEIPLILCTVPVIMLSGTLSLAGIVEAQNLYSAGIAHWNLFTPWGAAGFVLFLIAAAAEANRSPFDLPEGESEIIAGYYIEYSGFKFALFFLGEYLGLFAMCGLGITLFLGGWTAPFSFLTFIPSYIWFFLKLLALIFFFIWVRGTMPRIRMDQLMNFAWKFMLPLALINIVAAAAWKFTPTLGLKWVVCSAILLIGYVTLGQGLMRKANYTKRIYRFAT
ncbi:MAG: NADH-quinone oxidoreductase subunit NuoH [Limisphaerales bacterium]